MALKVTESPYSAIWEGSRINFSVEIGLNDSWGYVEYIFAKKKISTQNHIFGSPEKR